MYLNKPTAFRCRFVAKCTNRQDRFKIINGNFEISKHETDELKKEVNELKHNVLEDKVAHVEGNLGHTESCVQEMYNYQLDPAFTEDKLIDLEDRWRRNNLRVDDIKERPNETWEDCENENF